MNEGAVPDQYEIRSAEARLLLHRMATQFAEAEQSRRDIREAVDRLGVLVRYGMAVAVVLLLIGALDIALTLRTL